MSTAKLTAEIAINTSAGISSTKALETAMRTLNEATKTGAKGITTMRTTVRDLVTTQKTLIDQNIKVAKSYTDIANADRKARQERANSRAMTGAKVGEIDSRAGVNAARADDIKAISAKKQLTEAGRLQVVQAQKVTEQLRQQGVLEQINASKQRTSLALRKQMFREQQALNRAQQTGIVGMSGMRYVLADVGQSMRMIGVAMLALPVLAAKTAISWEREFANVIRTTGVSGQAISNLKGQFLQLVQTMPVSWAQLAEIGTLAGQLGIAEKYIGSFTKTVAIFSATTDVSVGDSATAFGRLNALLPDVQGNFTKLGDSILSVGVNSVATEGQIVRISTQIASIAGPAGFTSTQIVGLAGALASVGVPPELSRGVITRTFGKISQALSTGGLALEKWGKMLGMSGDQFRQSWNSDAMGTFGIFLEKIRVEGSAAGVALRELGITSVRDVPILSRLAGALSSTGVAGGLYAQTMRDASQEVSQGEMFEQYAIISGTVAAKIQVLTQTFQALFDTIGEAAIPMFGDLIDDWTESVRNFTRSLDEPYKIMGKFSLGKSNAEVLAMVAGFAAVVGGGALVLSLFTRIVQGSIALTQAVTTTRAAMGLTAATSAAATPAIAGAGGAMTGVGVAAAGATPAVGRFSGAMRLLKGVGIFAGIAAGIAIFDGLKNSIEAAGSSAEDVARKMLTMKSGSDLISGIELSGIGGQGGSGGFDDPWATHKASALEFRDALNMLEKEASGKDFTLKTDLAGLNRGVGLVDKLKDGFQQLKDSGQNDVIFSSVNKLAKDFELSNDQLLRLIYNTPALNSVFKDTLAVGGVDELKENLVKLGREGLAGVGIEADGATDSVAEFVEELTELEQQQQASMDSLAKAADGFIDFNTAIKAATDEGVFSLSTFMDTLRAQAEAQTEWQTNMGTLAARGISSAFMTYLADLGPDAAVLIQDFVADPEAFAEAEALWTAHGGMASAGWANAMVTNKYLADQVGALYGTAAGNAAMAELTSAGSNLPAVVARWNAILEYQRLHPQVSLGEAEAAVDAFIRFQNSKVIHLQARVSTGLGGAGGHVKDAFNGGYMGKGFAGGGWTGKGGKFDPAGTVHRGEFVMDQKATRVIGVPRLYEMMRDAQRGNASATVRGKSSADYVPSYGSSRSKGNNNSAATITVVELSVHDRKLLAAVGNTNVNVGGQVIANVTNSVNSKNARRGTN